MCVRCGARRASGLAWEDRRAGPAPWRWLKTVGQLVARPGIAFPGPARPGRAIAFSALCGLGLGAVLLAMAGLLLTDPGSFVRLRFDASRATFAAAMAIALVLPAALTVLFALAQAASFAVGLASAGRRVGVLPLAVRACAYAQAMLLVCVLVPFAGAVAAVRAPSSLALFVTVRVLWVVACAAWPVLTGRICWWAGRGAGLSGGRAAFAAFGPALLCLPPAAYLSHEQLAMLEAPQLYL